MKKPQNPELNFLYMEDKQNNKKKATKKKEINKKSRNISKNKKKNVGAGRGSAQENNTFNFDNEIVIGVTKLPDTNKKNNVKNKTNKAKTSKKINENKSNIKKTKTQEKIDKTNKNTKIKRNNQNLKNNTKRNKTIKRIIKWTILISALIASFIFFMMSPLFNLAQIEVENNEKINTDTIISLSGLTLGENIYKTSTNKIKRNIKQNAYIENVIIKRKLPNTIIVTVKERKTTYNLEYASSFAYINNQGYILEISSEKLEVPIIEGYTTSEEDIKVNNRLNNEDLERLGTVLKIMESAGANDISNLITRIDISNKQNYKIILENENKTVYLGDASNLSNRILYLKAILKEEKGVEGEIFINGDLSKDNVYFRKKE